MGMLIGLIGLIAGIGSLICWVMVLIKLFQDKGPLHGVLGLICGLYTFIWGWMNADRHKIQPIMMGWTACILASIFLNVLATMLG